LRTLTTLTVSRTAVGWVPAAIFEVSGEANSPERILVDCGCQVYQQILICM